MAITERIVMKLESLRQNSYGKNREYDKKLIEISVTKGKNANDSLLEYKTFRDE